MRIDCHRGFFFALEPTPEEVKVIRELGFRTIPIQACSCDYCGMGKLFFYWSRDETVAFLAARACSAEFTPAARASLDRAKDREVLSRATSSHDPTELPGLREFQVAAVTYAVDCFDRGIGAIIADEMGCGKTVEAIAIALRIEATRVLVVCPASLRLNWAREIQTWAKVEPVLLSSGSEVRDGQGWFITNPDRLISVRRQDGKLEERADALHRNLMKSGIFDLLIVDEAHLYANPKSGRTLRVFGERKKLRAKGAKPRSPKPAKGVLNVLNRREGGVNSRARHVVALTGTPIPNRPKDMASVLHSICPDFGTVTHFMQRYCDPKVKEVFVRGGHGKTRRVPTFDGGSNLAELRVRLRRSCMIRRTKEDVLRELPEKMRQVLPVSSPEIRAVLSDELEFWSGVDAQCRLDCEELLASAKTGKTLFEVADRLRQKAASSESAGKLASIRKRIAIAKVPLVVDLVNHVLQSKSCVVVMAHHREVVETLCEQIDDSVKLYGGMSEKEKMNSVTQFQSGNARAFVGSMKAAGVGITLTKSDTILFAEHDWVPAVIFQAEDRIHRIGQLLPVHVLHVVAEGTIEAAIIEQVLRKQTIIDQSLDKASPQTYPKATLALRGQAATHYQRWESVMPSAFSPKTAEIVKAVALRIRARFPTDGEVHLCQRLCQQANVKF